jgi:trimeric autotransporter adhesin
LKLICTKIMNKILITSFFVLLFWILSVGSYSQIETEIIYPFAGNGYGAGMGYLYGGYSGDGGPASSAEFDLPYSIVLDDSGNLYIADDANYRIRKINTSGIITTIAGNGAGAGTLFAGYTGDGGPATDAELGDPGGLAIDKNGNIYFGDGSCERIRVVNTSGIISTFAGNGIYGYSGDGGPATAAEIWNPFCIAVSSSGNAYIADLFNNRVRVVDTSGIISTFAGNGFGAPLGGMYNGDGGPATAAELNLPICAVLDAIGNVYIADRNNNRIRKVNTSGIINTIAGNGASGYSGDGGPATNAELGYPVGVSVDDSFDVFITDFSNRIRKVNSSGNISTIAGNGYGSPSGGGNSGDGGPASAAELNGPTCVVIDTGGWIYIADAGNNRIRKVARGIYDIPSESENYNGINIYPVPTGGLFTVTGVIVGQMVEMYNYLGQKLSKTSVDNTVMYFDISTEANGVYFIKIQNSNGSIVAIKKIVKTQ